LSDDDLAIVVAGLEKRFARKVQPHVHVDESLIGGVRIAVGDEVIESSVRGRLAAMRSSLATGS
jgi:F-type H+-transporting ATPase subunit delta